MDVVHQCERLVGAGFALEVVSTQLICGIGSEAYLHRKALRALTFLRSK
jgi:hypothetical protein